MSLCVTVCCFLYPLATLAIYPHEHPLAMFFMFRPIAFCASPSSVSVHFRRSSTIKIACVSFLNTTFRSTVALTPRNGVLYPLPSHCFMCVPLLFYDSQARLKSTASPYYSLSVSSCVPLLRICVPLRLQCLFAAFFILLVCSLV